jgi:hypothetical protein
MTDKENIHDDPMREEAPKLFSIKKENPFGIPENYFEDTAEKISAECFSYKEKRSVNMFSISYRKILIPLAVAASLVVVFLLITDKQTKDHVASAVQYASADASGASEYLEGLIDNNDLDESLIVSELVNDDTTKSVIKTDENINKLNTNPVVMKDSVNNITLTEDDIIRYMLDEYGPDDLLN